jgi:hypothetical protein
MTWSRDAMSQSSRLKLWGPQIAAIGLLAAVVALLVLKKMKMVHVAELTAARVYDVLGTLLLLALLLERSLEVFITAWRGPEADKLRLEVSRQAGVTKQLEVLPAAERTARAGEVQTAQNDLHAAAQTELDYKAVTQRNALSAALVVGTLISTLGFRTLERLATTNALAALPPWQQTAFAVVDVLLTGSVIAGGSEGIHSIINSMIRFFDQTAKRLREAS